MTNDLSDKEIELRRADGESLKLAVRKPVLGAPGMEISPLYSQFGMVAYDPGFGSTASCESAITYLDGARGELLFRGYPIEQLADSCSFVEVCSLLLNGQLPTKAELEAFKEELSAECELDESIAALIKSFPKEAHPMAILTSAVAALAGCYHEEIDIRDPGSRTVFARRAISKLPVIAAAIYRHRQGLPFVAPNKEQTYAGNLLHMMFGAEVKEVASRALDLLFVLHADHSQNASTSTVRLAGSSGTDPYAALAAGVASLWGPAHGGANEAVLRMLHEIGTADRIDHYVARAKDRNDAFRLMGFGHRVYKNYDPRAKIIRSMTHELLGDLGSRDEPLLDLAIKLEQKALDDEYFVSHKLYPNVDYYSGIIYSALGIPVEMFTVMFAVARTAGWVTHWCEMISDPHLRIGRPRQIYIGSPVRDVKPLDKR